VSGDETKILLQTSTPVVAAAPQIQSQRPASTQPVPTVSQSQPPTANADAETKPASEASVAEAARQARIAKAVREAKEKAERDNPPPPQQ
jgi:hypothetical protein